MGPRSMYSTALGGREMGSCGAAARGTDAANMEAVACTSGRLGAAPALPRQCAQPALARARPAARARRGAQAVVASMGLGFHVGQPGPSGLVAPQEPQLLLPEHDYGLSVKQMQVLGLTDDATGFGARLPEVKAVSAAARPIGPVGRCCRARPLLARLPRVCGHCACVRQAAGVPLQLPPHAAAPAAVLAAVARPGVQPRRRSAAGAAAQGSDSWQQRSCGSAAAQGLLPRSHVPAAAAAASRAYAAAAAAAGRAACAGGAACQGLLCG